MSLESKKLDALRSTVESLQMKLKEKEVEVRRLSVRNSLDKDSQRVGHLEKKLEKAKEEYTRLEQEVCSLKQERGSLEYEVDLLRNLVDLQSAPDEHVAAADAIARCKVLEGDVSLLTKKLRSAEIEVQTRRESETSARKVVDETSEEQRRLVSQVSALSSRLKEFEDESSRFRDEADQLAAERDEASDLMIVMEETIFDLETRVGGLKKEVESYKAKAEEAEKECSGARLSWSEGDRELNALKERVAALEAEKAEQASHQASTRQVEQSLRKELDASHRALEELQADNMRLQEAKSNLEASLANCKGLDEENEALQNDLEDLQAELDQQKNSERVVIDKCKALEERVETLQGSVKSIKHRYESDIQQLEESQANLAKRCEELGHECADKESQLDRITHDLKRAVEKLANASLGFGADTTSFMCSSSSASPQSHQSFSVARQNSSTQRTSHTSVTSSPSPSARISPFQGVQSGSTGRSKAAAAKLAQLLSSIGDHSTGTSSTGNLSSYLEEDSGSGSNGGRYSEGYFGSASPGIMGARVAVSLDADTSRGFDESPHTATTTYISRFRNVGGVSPTARIGLNDAPSSLRVSPMTPQ